MGGAGVAEGLLEACRVEESRVEVHPDKFKRFHGQGRSLGGGSGFGKAVMDV